jgi:hypothetical protein
MKCINNPALLSGFPAVFMYPAMAPRTKSRKKIVAIKQRPMALCFMVDFGSFYFLASLAHRVESQIGFANLCILLVFTLALGGCIPQPSAALEALRSFQWSF